MANLQSKSGGTSSTTTPNLTYEEELAKAATGSKSGDIQGANLYAAGDDPIAAAVSAFGSGTAGGAAGDDFQSHFEASVKRFSDKGSSGGGKSSSDTTTTTTTTTDGGGGGSGGGGSSDGGSSTSTITAIRETIGGDGPVGPAPNSGGAGGMMAQLPGFGGGGGGGGLGLLPLALGAVVVFFLGREVD